MRTGKTYFEDVVLWNLEMNHYVSGSAEFSQTFHGQDAQLLAMRLVDEEFHELADAFLCSNITDLADAGADLIWTVCGLMGAMGIDLDEAWEEVRRTNWYKVGGPRRADGKILKPEGWKPPDMTKAINGRGIGHIK